LIEARFKYFLLGRSAPKDVVTSKLRIRSKGLNMRRMLPAALPIFQIKMRWQDSFVPLRNIVDCKFLG
jgi:hypothetical protein